MLGTQPRQPSYTEPVFNNLRHKSRAQKTTETELNAPPCFRQLFVVYMVNIEKGGYSIFTSSTHISLIGYSDQK